MWNALILSLVLNLPTPYQIFTDWTVEMNLPQDARDQVQSVYLGGLSPEEESFYTSDKKHLVAKRSLLSGEIIWRSAIQGEAQSQWMAHGDSLYGGDTRGRIFRIRKSDGSIVWERSSKGVFFAAPFVSNELVYFSNSVGTVEAFELESGNFLWQQSDPIETSLSLLSHTSVVGFGSLILAGFPSGVLQAFEPRSGSKVWSSSFAGRVQEDVGLNDVKSIASQGPYFAASSYNGNLRVWQSQGGSQKQLWEKQFSAASPALFSEDAKHFYLADRQDRLLSIETETGYIVWDSALPGQGSPPAFLGSRIWIGTSTGSILVFDRAGKELARLASNEGSYIARPIILSPDTAIFVSSRGIIKKVTLRKIRAS